MVEKNRVLILGNPLLPVKTNMTIWKSPFLNRRLHLQNGWFFHCHVSFQGCKRCGVLRLPTFFTFKKPCWGSSGASCVGGRRGELAVHLWGILKWRSWGSKKTGPKKAVHHKLYMGVSQNNGTPKSPILIGFSIINHPFWGPTPIFGNTHMQVQWPKNCFFSEQYDSTWTIQVDLCLAMLNLGDNLVTLAASSSSLWLFWEGGSSSQQQTMEWHNFWCQIFGSLRQKTEVAESSGFYTLKQCARSGVFGPKWAR